MRIDEFRAVLDKLNLLNEDVKGPDIPERIRTGMGNVTVPNPYHASDSKSAYYGDDQKWINLYMGDPEQYQFISKMQRANYEKLKAVLAAAGLKFDQFYAGTYLGTGGYNNPKGSAKLENIVGVVGNSETPTLVWHKYEGAVAGGGQNHVYVGNAKYKLTDFLAAKPAWQQQQLTFTPLAAGAEGKWRVMLNLSNGKGKYTKVAMRVKAPTSLKAKAIATAEFIKSKEGVMAKLKGFKVSWTADPIRIK